MLCNPGGGSLSKKHFNITFPSEIDKVKSILADIMSFLRENLPSIKECDKYDLRLIYSELLCNAVIHGNKNDSNKKVRLSIEITGNTISSSVTDEGSGFDYLSLLEEAKQENNLYKDHGRGILLVYSLSDEIILNAKGNKITFRKKVGLNG
jgi:serine/threonine-protein kinase RsbW